ncbi:MAG: hypothetical protein R3342_13295 [Lutibacter sp.]|uniref:hypothetical protein n=1 Tax=Lutibacter sp. TaxID=1925666 RepID=UPI00299EF4BD|nr:hypothetical protein [Lutibacter sp.]MDX1830509.1 hypothetical protein [Lutibacter sp.]
MIILLINFSSCKKRKKIEVNDFSIELNDTIYLGSNTGKILNYKTDNDKIDYLLSVIIENEYQDGIIEKDTFSDGTLSPWFGIYATKKGKMTIKGIILEEALNDMNYDIDSVLRIERKFLYFSKDVFVVDSIFKK